MMMPPTHMIGAVISMVQVSLHEQLDLLDVVGGAGQQRRRAEASGLLRREPGDVVEDRRPQVAAEPHPGRATRSTPRPTAHSTCNR